MHRGQKAGKCTGICNRMVTMEMNKNRSEKFERQNKWKRKRRIMDGLNYRSGNELSGGLPT